jgi:hypothetical protein
MWAQLGYRAYSAIKQGGWNTERIIKLCILAFPSFWVGYITIFRVISGSTKSQLSFMSVCIYFLEYNNQNSYSCSMLLLILHFNHCYISTCLLLYTFQSVNVLHLLRFSQFPDLFPLIYFSESEFSMFNQILLF